MLDADPLAVIAGELEHKPELPILQTIAVADGRIAEVRPFYWDTAAIRAATA